MRTTLILLLAAATMLHAQQSTLGEGDSYAWSGNLGWIDGTHNRPNTGDGFRFGEVACAGWLWSANTGWINLGTGLLKTDSMVIEDSDNDGISDAWEIAYTGNLTTMDATSDQDGDGFSDLAEYQSMTNPLSPSSFLKVTAIHPLTPGGTTTALTWTSSRTRLYRIETSVDLGDQDSWEVSPLDPQTFTADDAATTTRNTQNPAADKRFFRIKPVIPLQP